MTKQFRISPAFSFVWSFGNPGCSNRWRKKQSSIIISKVLISEREGKGVRESFVKYVFSSTKVRYEKWPPKCLHLSQREISTFHQAEVVFYDCFGRKSLLLFDLSFHLGSNCCLSAFCYRCKIYSTIMRPIKNAVSGKLFVFVSVGSFATFLQLARSKHPRQQQFKPEFNWPVRVIMIEVGCLRFWVDLAQALSHKSQFHGRRSI